MSSIVPWYRCAEDVSETDGQPHSHDYIVGGMCDATGLVHILKIGTQLQPRGGRARNCATHPSQCVAADTRLQIKYSALQSDHDSMSAVGGIELREDALHVGLDRAFGDVQLGGDQFVGLSGGDSAQHFDLAVLFQPQEPRTTC
jgi:hypothetical protein